MKPNPQVILAGLLSLAILNGPVRAAEGPVKVFILAGQSNMQGFGQIEANPDRNGGLGSLEFLVKNPATAERVAALVDDSGRWRIRDDVRISYLERSGPLTVGYGVRRETIGPELGFGWTVGDALDDPVLIIKCAWGGKSLAVDFRPPSAGRPPYSLGEEADEAIAEDPEILGKSYREMLVLTREAIGNLEELVPGSDGRYVLSGFGWHQGWNDRINDDFNAEYESNMAHFIQDVRRDLGAPSLPFVIAETGMTGPDETHPRALSLMRAQAAVAERPEFRGNVSFVGTRSFWRPEEQSPSRQGYHWNSNAETYFLIGEAMGEAMLTLVEPGGGPVREGEMSGYLIVPTERVPESFGGGFSMYVAAWPLLRTYPGNRFQSGLFGTWMFARLDEPPPEKLYSDIEGGLGWWRDTRFATETPKFIMGGVAPNFIEWANGPGAGKGRDWDRPAGKYGVAQLSPRLLWPPDGLNLKQGTRGELFGYGYLPLPLTTARATTDGKDVPTGDRSWTLFLNTKTFKGPVAFFTPYFWSHSTVDQPQFAGMLLDSRPSDPNRHLQMETQYIPAFLSDGSDGETYARIAPTRFPRRTDGESLLVHRIMSYSEGALWDSVKAWFEGGPPASGVIDPQDAVVHPFTGRGGATWRIYPEGTPREDRMPVAWDAFATPTVLDAQTFGYRWDARTVAGADPESEALVTLPEYFRLENDGGDRNSRWVPVPAEDVPEGTGLKQLRFDGDHDAAPSEPYVTPDDEVSSWKNPGPVAGPFQVKLGDGSVLTYSWYRFADQPALLNAGLSDAEREAIQVRIEHLHRHWTIDHDYLPPPTVGTLAELDPALIVTPPEGLEVGYVPIVTRQESSTQGP
ncbi:sialate O-acetylesterase [Tautonia marina]|uniref:sialate O-acetylesterase n=1 Tax=Tautonia marina TaxID=2653855 RepID=UPI00191BF00A|nr:sialate O-acetylesterase [Tautonia marina]